MRKETKIPKKTVQVGICKDDLNYLFVDPFELFETKNSALLKIVRFKNKFGRFKPGDEKIFRRSLPKIVDKVCKHFGVK